MSMFPTSVLPVQVRLSYAKRAPKITMKEQVTTQTSAVGIGKALKMLSCIAHSPGACALQQIVVTLTYISVAQVITWL
jgi:hypothetical protein